MYSGQAVFEAFVLSSDFRMAAQVVAEGQMPAFLFSAEDAQMYVVCAGTCLWLLEERVCQVKWAERGVDVAELSKQL